MIAGILIVGLFLSFCFFFLFALTHMLNLHKNLVGYYLEWLADRTTAKAGVTFYEELLCYLLLIVCLIFWPVFWLGFVIFLVKTRVNK